MDHSFRRFSPILPSQSPGDRGSNVPIMSDKNQKPSRRNPTGHNKTTRSWSCMRKTGSPSPEHRYVGNGSSNPESLTPLDLPPSVHQSSRSIKKFLRVLFTRPQLSMVTRPNPRPTRNLTTARQRAIELQQLAEAKETQRQAGHADDDIRSESSTARPSPSRISPLDSVSLEIRAVPVFKQLTESDHKQYEPYHKWSGSGSQMQTSFRGPHVYDSRVSDSHQLYPPRFDSLADQSESPPQQQLQPSSDVHRRHSSAHVQQYHMSGRAVIESRLATETSGRASVESLRLATPQKSPFYKVFKSALTSKPTPHSDNFMDLDDDDDDAAGCLSTVYNLQWIRRLVRPFNGSRSRDQGELQCRKGALSGWKGLFSCGFRRKSVAEEAIEIQGTLTTGRQRAI